jgi:L,D-peptidoglycan transpeptidase YkuD (ErfK/YbiS/YcfS/YnhG family)
VSPSVRPAPGVSGAETPAGGGSEGEREAREAPTAEPDRASVSAGMPYALGTFHPGARSARTAACARAAHAARSRRARHRAPHRARLPLLVLTLLGLGALGTNALQSTADIVVPWVSQPTAPAPRSAAALDRPLRQAAPLPDDRRLPGLGPHFAAQIPADARQALVVTGEGAGSWRSTATLWSRGDDDHWRPGPTWPAHNALRGWTTDHHEGDLHSPIGVFTLTAAGGLEPDPGARLPYERSSAFRAVGAGFEGEPLTGSFDYVIAIDYNRVPGSSPLDTRTPLGRDRGSGLWVHVDHQGPTHGCVALSSAHMVQLLRALDPADRPVIVMGDQGSLRR